MIGMGCGVALLCSMEADRLLFDIGVAFLLLLKLALELLALIGTHNMIIGVNGRYIDTHCHSIVYHPYTNAAITHQHKLKENGGISGNKTSGSIEGGHI